MHTFEFRVTGTVRRVDISHSSTSEGHDVADDRPAVVRHHPLNAVLMFLALTVAAREFDEGSLTAQLSVDGQLFREAHATGVRPHRHHQRPVVGLEQRLAARHEVVRPGLVHLPAVGDVVAGVAP